MTTPPAKTQAQPHGDPKGAGNGLLGVVVAAIPTALAYFMGWAYLYYYLAAFGVNISELDLGLETIFIYAAPPAIWAVIPVAVVVFLPLAFKDRDPVPARLMARLPNVHAWFEMLPPLHKGFVAFILLVPSALLLAGLVKMVAEDRADEKWRSVDVRIQAMVSPSDESSTQEDDYKSCMKRVHWT